jgi:hypothetical protein
VKDLHSGGEETYVFKNGETGQTFVYKKMPNAPPPSAGPDSP